VLDDALTTARSGGTYTYLTCRHPMRPWWTVANNATGALACDTLNVTVSPQPREAKVAPKTLNQKSNGIATNLCPALVEWLGV